MWWMIEVVLFFVEKRKELNKKLEKLKWKKINRSCPVGSHPCNADHCVSWRELDRGLFVLYQCDSGCFAGAVQVLRDESGWRKIKDISSYTDEDLRTIIKNL